MEMLTSVTVGAALSFVLTLILPGIETKSDIFGVFFPLWLLVTIGVWSMFDLAERIQNYVHNNM